jgi:hypothetical protein
MYLDNGGIFVCKTRHLQLAGGAKVSTVSSSVLNSNFFCSPRVSTIKHLQHCKLFVISFGGKVCLVDIIFVCQFKRQNRVNVLQCYIIFFS